MDEKQNPYEAPQAPLEVQKNHRRANIVAALYASLPQAIGGVVATAAILRLLSAPLSTRYFQQTAATSEPASCGPAPC
jgi:hypothetical protein